MSEGFSNAEQIAICKQEQHDKVFGKLDAEHELVRDSTAFRMEDCERAAGNNIMKYVQCLRDYQKNIVKDNAHLSSFLSQM